MEPDLTVVLPTLNEAANVGELLDRLDAALDGVAYEVVLVDDGSTDGTVETARAAHPSIRVVRRQDARGLGTAVVRGFREARGRFVAVMDADLQHPPEAVADLHRAVVEEEAELAVGSRYVPGGHDGGLGTVRRLVSRGAHALAWAALPTVRDHDLTDATSGLFLVRRDLVADVALSPTGYKVLLEVLQQARPERVVEVGFAFQDRHGGESKLTSSVLWAYLVHLATLAVADRENRRIAQFAAVGLVGVMVNLGLLYGLTEALGLYYLVSAAIAIEGSILHNFALNDLITFRDLRRGRWWGRLGRFHAVSALSVGVNLGVLYGLTEAAGIHYLASEAGAIGVAFALNYLGNRTWTYMGSVGEAGQRSGPAAAALSLRAWLGWSRVERD